MDAKPIREQRRETRARLRAALRIVQQAGQCDTKLPPVVISRLVRIITHLELALHECGGRGRNGNT